MQSALRGNLSPLVQGCAVSDVQVRHDTCLPPISDIKRVLLPVTGILYRTSLTKVGAKLRRRRLPLERLQLEAGSVLHRTLLAVWGSSRVHTRRRPLISRWRMRRESRNSLSDY